MRFLFLLAFIAVGRIFIFIIPWYIYGEEHMIDKYQTPLKIVEIGDPVLRQKARELQKEEILSPYIQGLIKDMTHTMRNAPGVGLAAPQVGISIQLIVIEDLVEYHNYLTPEQLKERDRSPVPFHVVINPKIYLDHSASQVKFFEGCLSLEDLCGLVPRASTVQIECLNEHAEPVKINAKGWYARILQHEIDHVNGILYIDRASPRTLTTRENFERHWKGKPINQVKNSEVCPCGTGKDYHSCCQPLHLGAFPGDALALMRSRYSAYVYGLSQYIIKTTDSKNLNYQANHVAWAMEITERCQNTEFQKLDILEFTNGSQEAYVTFIVHFIQNNRTQAVKEKSRFRKNGFQWLYLEGLLSSSS